MFTNKLYNNKRKVSICLSFRFHGIFQILTKNKKPHLALDVVFMFDANRLSYVDSKINFSTRSLHCTDNCTDSKKHSIECFFFYSSRFRLINPIKPRAVKTDIPANAKLLLLVSPVLGSSFLTN